LYGNKTYSLNCKLQKELENVKLYNSNAKYYYDSGYETVYADGCMIGIKRIAQCTDDDDDDDDDDEYNSK